MGDGDDIADRLRNSLQAAGRRYAEVRKAYQTGRSTSQLPRDEHGRHKIVCRRYVEKRATLVDDQGRPACFEEGHPDCEGCAEDVREGCIETW
jgi:hypothetical protein